MTSTRLVDRAEPLVRELQRRASSPGRSPRTAVVLGRLLGAGVVVCFATGLFSHLVQEQPAWLPLSPRPVWLYRATQGVHVAVGLALVPVLLGKLWAVYPRLFAWPPVTGVRSVLERLSVLVLVATALLQLATGVMNTAQWYAFPFSFKPVHLALSWVLLGSVVLHVAVKLPVIAGSWRAPSAQDEDADDEDDEDDEEAVARRTALTAVGAATAATVLLTVGQSLPALAPLALLSPRRPGVGPQGLPVNRTAREAGVLQTAVSADWRLEVVDERRGALVLLTLEELRAMPQTGARLPIACVEGWSQDADWSGVRLRELLALVGAPAGSDVRVSSLQVRGGYRTSLMRGAYAQDPRTLLALALGGEPLHLDHGHPARVIAPGRPGVLQTKWVRRVEVLS
ncbi:molybdopterin-dependent oxidoreductase [Streptomyces sp. NP160]|uniref:molybdopterin-dependent oxidoreductase n=1 Tax=Streptomyces sp. NP160 TaxID=2586637 RepID=UPI00214BA1F4|nr:molybdopterin-dependent oxidoreductase [Streptomyces sp. NP160]